MEKTNDDTTPAKFRLGFERNTALYWALLFTVLSITLHFVARAFGGTYGPMCIGAVSQGMCGYSEIVVDRNPLIFAAAFAITSAAWLVRKRAYDAHPLLINVTGWVGAYASVLVHQRLAAPLTSAMSLNATAVLAVVLLLTTSLGVLVGTFIQFRRPRSRYTSALVVAVPLLLMGFKGITIRSSAEIRHNVVARASAVVDFAVGSAERSTKSFVKNERDELATPWLGQPLSTLDEETSQELLGGVDDIGRGQDFIELIRHVRENAARDNQSLEQASIEFANNGVDLHAYFVGRNADGYCLITLESSVDPDKRFEMRGITPVTTAATWLRLRYCVLDKTLLGFSDKNDVESAANIGCVPKTTPNLYGDDPTDLLTGRFLLAASGGSDEPLEALHHEAKTLAEQGQAHAFVPAMIAAFSAHRQGDLERAQKLDAACSAKLETWYDKRGYRAPSLALPEAFQADDWGRQAAHHAGAPPSALVTDEAKDGRLGAFFLQSAISSAQRSGRVPDPAALRPVFGQVLDSFSSYDLNMAFKAAARRASFAIESDKSLVDHIAQGVDLAHYVVGKRRSGWCLYNLSAKAVEDTSGERRMVEAKLDYRLRYCLAGDELVSFDDDGNVEQTWDATGFERRAPLVDPTDFSRFVGAGGDMRARAKREQARLRLLRRFLEGLIAGELTEASQLEALELAEGAEHLEPEVKAAMRRMLAE